MKDKNKQNDPRLRIPSAAAMTGIFAVALFLVLAEFTEFSPLACFAVCALTVIAVSIVCFAVLRREQNNEDEKFGRSLGQIMLEIVIKMHLPMVICDTTGKIIWRNRAFGAVTASIGSVMGADIASISTVDPETLSEDTECDAELCERSYSIHPFRFKTDEKSYWFIVFSDRTETDALKEQVKNERGVVAYVLVDNLDELSQGRQDAYRSEANDVSGILREFAASLDGILREYDRNKYILLMNHGGLAKCRANNFDILDRVRDIRVGDLGLPITISIGITDTGDTLSAREAGAREALSMALARGGDQVAYKSADGMEFYGGNSKPMQKRSSVAAKVRSGELIARISRASGVLIMGHNGADQDCFGASVGIARLAMYCYVKPYIVVDRSDPNTQRFLAKFEHVPEYADVFVDEHEAQDLIRSDTLLVVVDVNNIDHMLSPGIAFAVNDAVVIDHHRKTDSERKRDYLTEYIEPSASSASELISEILEQTVGDGMLLKEEADALLGGILLDTKQFTKSTGTRTLGAAIYLRSAGANITETSGELRSEFSEFRKQSRILADPVIYKGRFAIAKDESEGVPLDRIAAAKAAESLLTVKGVDAAFALIRIGNETHISARSNASVSVQLILEKMGGGGHLDSAGAKSSDPMLSVLEQLKAAIDEYLDENKSVNQK